MNCIGAIFGDVAGSVYEWHNIRSKQFTLLAPRDGQVCDVTDDSVMTVAVAAALAANRDDCQGDLDRHVAEWMRKLGRAYPDAGYGGRFSGWLADSSMGPYNSWGNGSAMRASPCGWAASSLSEAEAFATVSAEVTHNHPEGVKGAKAVAGGVWLARHGAKKPELKAYWEKLGYVFGPTVDEIRPGYGFDVSCPGSVPPAMQAFLESTDFVDCVKTTISLGGDSDTLAAISGAVAEAFYGVPPVWEEKLMEILRPHGDLFEILSRFQRAIIA